MKRTLEIEVDQGYVRTRCCGAILVGALLLAPCTASANELHVATTGSDADAGDEAHPFLTIGHAAQLAMPGDTVIVHEGTYRERVTPARGGTASAPIVYRAAGGAAVSIKGSNRITSWTRGSGSTWSVDLPADYFGAFNPYVAQVSGSYLVSGQWHHLGQVYLDDEGYREVQSAGELGSEGTWYTEQSGGRTRIVANFGSADPNVALAEINVRSTVFFPSQPGVVDYVTVQGFTISQAATNWAPPNVDVQEGAIGSLGGAHWIIRNCTIRYSRNVGISLGNYGGFDSRIPEIGHHLIENNLVERCGQAGIAGVRFASSSRVVGNLIQDIDYLDEWFGYEQANVKFHDTCDVTIEANLIRQGRGHVLFGAWIDWANTNTRFSRNVIEGFNGLYQLEEDHGPMLFDNNVFVGGQAIEFSARSTVGVHNLYVRVSDPFGGADTSRSPYVFAPHTIESTSDQIVAQGSQDQRWNDVYVGTGLATLTGAGSFDDYNLYLAGATRSFGFHDTHGMVSSLDPHFTYVSDERGFAMSWDPGDTLDAFVVRLLDSDTFGVFAPVGMRVESPDGSTITFDHDFFGMARDADNPRVGPFATGTVMTDRLLFDARLVGAASTPTVDMPGTDAGATQPGTDAGRALSDAGVATDAHLSLDASARGDGSARSDGGASAPSAGCGCSVRSRGVDSPVWLLGLLWLAAQRRRRSKTSA